MITGDTDDDAPWSWAGRGQNRTRTTHQGETEARETKTERLKSTTPEKAQERNPQTVGTIGKGKSVGGEKR